MTVLELKNLLKKCNDEDIVKIRVREYSSNGEEIIDETFEDPGKAIYEVYLDNEDQDTFILSITLYKK